MTSESSVKPVVKAGRFDFRPISSAWERTDSEKYFGIDTLQGRAITRIAKEQLSVKDLEVVVAIHQHPSARTHEQQKLLASRGLGYPRS